VIILKKNTIIQIAIVIVLTIILSVLVIFTIKAINENNSFSQGINSSMKQSKRNMQNKIERGSNSISSSNIE